MKKQFETQWLRREKEGSLRIACKDMDFVRVDKERGQWANIVNTIDNEEFRLQGY
jgi:hypothetical protein